VGYIYRIKKKVIEKNKIKKSSVICHRERERERDGCGHPKEEKVCDGLWEHEPRALDPKGLHLSRANFYLSLSIA